MLLWSHVGLGQRCSCRAVRSGCGMLKLEQILNAQFSVQRGVTALYQPLFFPLDCSTRCFSSFFLGCSGCLRFNKIFLGTSCQTNLKQSEEKCWLWFSSQLGTVLILWTGRKPSEHLILVWEELSARLARVCTPLRGITDGVGIGSNTWPDLSGDKDRSLSLTTNHDYPALPKVYKRAVIGGGKYLISCSSSLRAL